MHFAAAFGPVFLSALLALVALLGSGLAAPSWAAASADDLLREALLRGYTRQEAQARYTATRREMAGMATPAQADGVGAALGNLGGALAGMAERNQARADAERSLYNAMNAAVEKRLEYPLDTVLDAQTMKRVLVARVERNNDDWARRRLIEYMLHQRQHAKYFYEEPDYATATSWLRPFAYSRTQLEAWAALTLAKLYIVGKGVPRDKGEAARLAKSCAFESSTERRSDAGEVIACRVLLVNMHRNGWGFEADG
jgi:hypothetical protein